MLGLDFDFKNMGLPLTTSEARNAFYVRRAKVSDAILEAPRITAAAYSAKSEQIRQSIWDRMPERGYEACKADADAELARLQRQFNAIWRAAALRRFWLNSFDRAALGY